MSAPERAMTKVLIHPDARVVVEARPNGLRQVTVQSNDPAMFMPWRSMETAYPIELIQAVLDVKGPAYLCDEMLRDESPTYVQSFLERDLFAYRPREWFQGKRLLDFGCGAGASTMCLARLLSDSTVVGIEMEAALLDLAQRRARYHGYTNVQWLRSPSAMELPPDMGLFDGVILSAVYEHFLPNERTRLLPLLWDIVKPGGVLFLNQTPHRWFPLESHTTGLPFINYLPDPLALAMARTFSKRVRRDETWENLLRYGVRGATEGEMLAVLASSGAVKPLLLEPGGEGIRDRIDLWSQALNPHRYRSAKKLIKCMLKLIRWTTGITLVPTLSLMIQKSKQDTALTAGERTLRVCFISPLGYGLYQPTSGYPFGGAEVQFYLLAHELARDNDFRVTVLVTVREQPGLERHGSLTVVKRLGKGRLGPRLLTFHGLRGALTSFQDMRKQLHEIDADIYLHAGAGVEVGAYALICRLLRRRFIYTVASSADLSDAQGYVRGPLRRLFPLGVRMADAVVCRTEDQMRDLASQFGRTGVLIRTAHPATPAPPAFAYTMKSTILWVGRMHPLKQPELFLTLAERLPKERFVMVAMRDATHDPLRQSVRRRAAGLKNVTIHEDVSWQNIGRFFDEAKLFVNTSTYEGFPNTFVQAAMASIPILSLNVDPDGVLTRHGIGLCAAGSFERLVEATDRLCASDQARIELGRAAGEYARAHHDLNRSVHAWETLLRQ